MNEQQPIHHPDYVKVWGVLVVLLLVSILVSWTGFREVTIGIAFAVAFAKAYLVAKNFMHIHLQARWIPYLLIVCIAFMVVLFVGLAPDVLRHRGLFWVNFSAEQAAPDATHGPQ